MRRCQVQGALLCGLGLCGLPGVAHAETLFTASGQVALADGLAPDGVKVKLQVDLNRDGKLESYETLNGTVASDGSYALDYQLDPADVDLKFVTFVAQVVGEYQARGFESLLDDGPLPILLSFEREGYSTVVKRVSTLFEQPSLDVTLTPLADVQCADGSCLSPDGGVRLAEFPGGTKIARAYADAYDPAQETRRFPGLFTDKSNNLLVSSGFAEINLFQEDGTPVHAVSSPVAVRFEAQRPSWSTLPDLETNTGRIELPMYSFDQVSGEWIPEQQGELQLADGKVVSEDDLAALHDGSFEQQVFVAFDTTHFSTFNCDAPISIRTCVRGKLLAKGTAQALAGLAVSVDGVSYTGSAGVMITGLDGTFATDVRKSELASEDLDNNGETGELLEAHVVATGTGVYVGPTFTTPTDQATVGAASRPDCRPDSCDCLDLGELEVELEEPRLCEVTVEVTFSGRNVVGGDGPLLEGEAVVGASLRGALAGSIQLPQAAVQAACADTQCSSGVVPDSGLLTFSVPVVGEAPELKLEASLDSNEGGTLHYYSGSLVVTGCAPGETSVSETVTLTLDHAELNGLGEFIASLGELSKPSTGGANGAGAKDPFGGGPSCGCRATGSSENAPGAWALGLLLASVLGFRQRKRRR